MFRYATFFYVIALATTVPAFAGTGSSLTVWAQVAFGVALALAVLTLMLGLMRRGL